MSFPPVGDRGTHEGVRAHTDGAPQRVVPRCCRYKSLLTWITSGKMSDYAAHVERREVVDAERWVLWTEPRCRCRVAMVVPDELAPQRAHIHVAGGQDDILEHRVVQVRL
eukprot:6098780-Prymnesium_polylepis.1